MQSHIARIPDRINLMPEPNAWHHVAVQGVVEIHARVKLTAGRNWFFFEKNQKTLEHWIALYRQRRVTKIKSFCFFFSKRRPALWRKPLRYSI
jgi:hypothetical protein